jgi:Asp-tRNA(Asn)/Glu-tRNA(Gln) amidotransferase A subunit family amidase
VIRLAYDGRMLSRREALAALAALAATAALPRASWASVAGDPLEGTIADCAAGLRSGRWSAAEVTARALERCRTDGATWRAIDALSATAIAEAKAADARRRSRNMRGPLDGVPVFAKAIYDMNGLPTTASNAEWARIFPEPARRDAIEVTRLPAAGIAAMVYPTMPFNAFRLADGWPDIRTALGYGNWLGLPEVSVPAGLGADGLPALNLSVTGLPGEDAHALVLAHAYERQSRRFVPALRRW